MKIKHIIKFVLIAVVLVNCSDSDPLTAPVPKPVAYNDLFVTLRNEAIVVSDILKNDNNSEETILELDSSSTEGEVVSENGVITFTPLANFSGTDSFKYTICEPVENNCSSATVFINVETGNTSIAVKDSYTIIANKVLLIDDLVANDVIFGNVTVKSVEKVNSTEGEVKLDNGNVEFTPKKDFTGEDSFTYTICDEGDNCSSALVVINVTEGINAVDDNYNATNTKAITISDLLDNDFIVDGTKIVELNTLATEGTVTLQEDGNVVYEPKTAFTGEDSFTYTICDDGTKNSSCATATVTINVLASINFSIPSSLENYYNNVLFVQDTTFLLEELKDLSISKHTTILTYSQRHTFLYDADEDPNNTANVLLVYTGESRDEREWISGNNPHSTQTFNTEHIYPRSKLIDGEDGPSFADLHHLRVCDESVNRARLNYSFVEGSGNNKLIGGNTKTWFPGDEWKGDIARMIFYLNARYGETFEKVGSLNLFLKWNVEDPVSAFEEQRNNVIFGAQGNRNPFIDNPFLATLIWGGDAAENKWE